MMSRPTIVRSGYILNSSTYGKRSYQPIRGLIHYLTYGNVLKRMTGGLTERGTWLNQIGQAQSETQVKAWARAKVHRFGYDHAYQLLLSTSKGGLNSADFNTALQAGSAISDVREWRLMLHTDTNNQHAHAILFRHEKLSKQDYLAWQHAMQQTLDKRQMQRLLEQEQVLEQGHQPSQQKHNWRIEL